jgi:protein-S-isoprenylcysteine O-methyltransferase Ste14
MRESKHPNLRIVRHAIKPDLIQFGLPALVVFTAGLVISGTTGWRGLKATAVALLGRPGIPQPPFWESVGLLMVGTGFIVIAVALGTLRLSYSSSLVIRQEHRLVTHGIYRLVRHPIYLGVLMVCLGLAAHAESLPGAVTMAVLVPLFINRIRLEEGLLVERFGEAYRSYRETTRKLIPFVY